MKKFFAHPKSLKDLDEEQAVFLEFHESRKKEKDTFLLPLEDFSVEKMNELLRWIGLTHCNYTDILHENNHGYQADHRSVLNCQ